MPQPNDLSRSLVAQQNGFAQDSVLEEAGRKSDRRYGTRRGDSFGVPVFRRSLARLSASNKRYYRPPLFADAAAPAIVGVVARFATSGFRQTTPMWRDGFRRPGFSTVLRAIPVSGSRHRYRRLWRPLSLRP